MADVSLVRSSNVSHGIELIVVSTAKVASVVVHTTKIK